MRAATALTVVRGQCFHGFRRAELDEHELYASMYHGILEAAPLPAGQPPASELDFNEGDFERAAQEARTARTERAERRAITTDIGACVRVRP